MTHTKGIRIFVLLAALALSGVTWAQVDADPVFQQRVVDAVNVHKAGKTDEAIQALETLVKENPGSYDARSWLGFLYLSQGQAEKAVPHLEQALLQRPMDLEIQNNLGNAYLATKQYDKALERYREVARLNPAMYEPHYNIGNIALLQGDHEDAVTAYNQAAKLNPEDPFVQNNLGVALEKQGKLEPAAQAFKRASDLRKDNGTFAANAGLVLVRLKRADEAITYLERAKAAGSLVPEVTFELGHLYSGAGRNPEALRQYEALKESPTHRTNPTYWFNLGVLRARNGDNRGAEQAYRRALEFKPNDLDALNNLGLLLYRRQSYGDAKAVFLKLSGLNPTSQEAKMNLAAAAIRAGDRSRPPDLAVDSEEQP